MDFPSFANARAAAARWLEQEPACVRVNDGASSSSWYVNLDHPTLGGHAGRLVLPRDFPSNPALFFVHKSLFLRLPHVEADGKVCLGVRPWPADFDHPVDAVVRVLEAVQDLLPKWADSAWVAREFEREKFSYWNQFCGVGRGGGLLARAYGATFVSLADFGGWAERDLVAYRGLGTRPSQVHLVVACPGQDDPDAISRRHGWARGTMERGRALFARISSTRKWSPDAWPKTWPELEIVLKECVPECSLNAWSTGTPRSSAKARKKESTKLSMVFLVQDKLVFCYQVSAITRVHGCPQIVPRRVTRIDPEWCLARDTNTGPLTVRRAARVLLLGCGSLGSPIAELLVRSGVGHIDIVDDELLEPPNIGRHILGARSVRASKAEELAKRLRTEVPGSEVTGICAEASAWIAQRCIPGRYSLIVECTGESRVRTFLSHARQPTVGSCPVAHVWIEPFCSAAHVVLSQPSQPWPPDDPADDLINAADFLEETSVLLPACGTGFHPYGATDVWQAAGFAAERILVVLDDKVYPSTVWSWIRSEAFFNQLGVRAHLRSIVPPGGSPLDAVTLARPLAEVLGE